MSERMYFRQFQSGVDYAIDSPMAVRMVNLTYAVGDRELGVAVLVDPAYDPGALISLVESDGLKVVGVVATHYHPDHVGGELMGNYPIAGIVELLGDRDVPVHANVNEIEWIIRRTGVGVDSLVAHDSGDVLTIGDIEMTLIHTPGHSAGSQCLLVEDHLISGDTLFLEGCGRTDLPGSDPREMYRTLTQRLAPLGGQVVVHPGHRYAPESSKALSDVRVTNSVFSSQTEEQWLATFA